MQKEYKKYFWDSSKESFSKEYQLNRIIEYASFPDLIKYPFDEMKKNINKVNINSLRTGYSRVKLIQMLKPYILKSRSWEEVMNKYLADCFERNEYEK